MVYFYFKCLFCLFLFPSITSFIECISAHEREIFMVSMKKLMSDIRNHPNLTWIPELPKKFTAFHDVLVRGTVRPNNVHSRNVDFVTYNNDSEPIPKSFDSRTHWKNCTSIGKIRDQSNCASSWAFGAVEAMSDRICIKSKGKIRVTLSAVDLLSCCSYCGFGCSGGDTSSAWRFWVENGIVTGNSNETHQGCRPYPFPKCEHYKQGKYENCTTRYSSTPQCVEKCQSSYKKSYNEDKYYGKRFYFLINEQSYIQREIMKYGPVQASFKVYEDFLLYKSGIYQNIEGKILFQHAIKIIGWGETNGTPYWLCVNSWNEDWGEKGLFKILRGQDHCEIERDVHAGISWK